jgi:hypothetical protein
MLTNRKYCLSLDIPCVFMLASILGMVVERALVFETVIVIMEVVSMMTDRETAGNGAEMAVTDTKTVKIDTEKETTVENDIGMKENVTKITVTEVKTENKRNGREMVKNMTRIKKMNSIRKHLIVNVIVVIRIAIIDHTILSAGDRQEGVVVSSSHFVR